MVNLKHKVSVLVPSTVDGDVVNVEAQRVAVRHVALSMVDRYGGATIDPPMVGMYKMTNDMETETIVEESPIRVWSYCEDPDTPFMVGVGEYVKEFMTQKSVLIEIDGSGVLI